MMDFEAVIGLEIHVEMRTKSKMFSAAPNAFSKNPNTHVAPLDMAFPGTMPTINKRAVINAIRVANALHMSIDHTLYFDRKNYFYSDLPKGYQITQENRPIGKDGYLLIKDKNDEPKVIHVQRLHMEEDTCKQVHLPSCTLLDYNRAGVPLLEIVSSAEIRNGVEAMRFVEAIRNIVVYSKTSNGKMEEGSLRCDVNISLRPAGSNELGTKVELKNLNSLKNIALAIDQEILRQSKLLSEGKSVLQETRRYDEAKGQTVAMRKKADAIDYKYFCDSNIAPIVLSDEFVEEAIATCPELYEEKKARYEAMGLSAVDAAILLSDIGMATYFEEAIQTKANPKTIANFLIVEVNGYLNKNKIAISEFRLTPSDLAQIAAFQEEGYSHAQCVDIFVYSLNNGVAPSLAKEALGIQKQSEDDSLIRGYVLQALEDNPKSIADYRAGKDRVIGFLVGQVMKATKGKLSPSIVAEIVKEELLKYAENQ